MVPETNYFNWPFDCSDSRCDSALSGQKLARHIASEPARAKAKNAGD